MVQAPRKAVEEPRLEVNMQTLMTAPADQLILMLKVA